MTKILKTIMAAVSGVMLLVGCSMNLASLGSESSSVSINKGDISKANVTMNVKISVFNKIEAAQGIQIIFTQGNFNGIAQVRTTPSAEKYLSIDVNKGVLSVRYKNIKGDIEGPTIVSVQAPDLNEIDLTSAASIEVKGSLKINGKLSMDLTSAASVTLNSVTATGLYIDQTSASSVTVGNLNLNTFSLDMTSASDANIGKVTATKMDVETTSAAKCVIKGFNGSKLDASATSGSDILISDIKATEVEAEATSGADITLSGECEKLSTNSSSGGSVVTKKLYFIKDKKVPTPSKGDSELVLPRIP